MKLTPLDIKKQEFTRTFRGIDPQEVQGFLDMVADQWGALMDENRRLEQNVRDMEAKLVHYRKIEEALQEALETARDNSHKTLENAQREAQIILKEARTEAEEIRGKAFGDHKRLKSDVSKIAGRRDEIMARLRAFLMSELEILARFEGQDPIGFIRLSAPEKRKLDRPSHSLDAFDEPDESEDESAYPFGDGRANPPVAPQTPPPPAARPPAPAPSTPPPPPSVVHRREDEFRADERSPAEIGGLSSDELDFIKATVTTAAHQSHTEEFFQPAEPIEEEQWMQASAPSADPFQDTPDATFEVDQREEELPHVPFGDPPPAAPNWVRTPIISSPRPPAASPPADTFDKPLFGDSDDHDDLTATPEEIEKIRRILNDLD